MGKHLHSDDVAVDGDIPVWTTDHWEYQPAYVTELGAGVDLDTVVTSGRYTQTEAAEVGTNYPPVTVGGILEVRADPLGANIWQSYTCDSSAVAFSDAAYSRVRTGGVWSDWVATNKVLTTLKTNPLDLNDYRTTGIYLIHPAAIDGPLPPPDITTVGANFPHNLGQEGILEVLADPVTDRDDLVDLAGTLWPPSQQMVVQRFTAYSRSGSGGNMLWQRQWYYRDAAWMPWRQVGGFDKGWYMAVGYVLPWTPIGNGWEFRRLGSVVHMRGSMTHASFSGGFTWAASLNASVPPPSSDIYFPNGYNHSSKQVFQIKGTGSADVGKIYVWADVASGSRYTLYGSYMID